MMFQKFIIAICVSTLLACSYLPTPHTPTTTTVANHHTLFHQALNAYQQKDYATALTQFQAADLAGNLVAPRYLGIMYLNGDGVKSDEQLAFTQFQRAAKYGDVAAQYWLAHCYEHGIGTTKNLVLAKQYYVQSAQKADAAAAPALFALGRWYETGVAGSVDSNRAMNYYQLAAATGYQPAQIALQKKPHTADHPSAKSTQP